jgi:hypothetical protein
MKSESWKARGRPAWFGCDASYCDFSAGMFIRVDTGGLEWTAERLKQPVSIPAGLSILLLLSIYALGMAVT